MDKAINNNSKWLSKLNDNPIPWLLSSNPWTRYRTYIDLLELPPTDSEVLKAKTELINHPHIQSLLTEAGEWFSKSITRHNDPKICFYKLRMLVDFGLDRNDSGINTLIANATSHLVDEMYATRQTLPKPGLGLIMPDVNANEWHALPCDTPLITYALLKMGIKDSQMNRVINLISNKWNTRQGWFCHFFFVEKQHQKLQIGCPMAGLMALEVFSSIPELKESASAKNAYETLKFHYECGQSVYFFGRSKKFWTLKYPFVWYNALYLAEVLTRFEFLKYEPLVKELINWIEESQDELGRWKATSMFMEYKNWDFADKKVPSPWITLLCCRILKRWYEIN